MLFVNGRYIESLSPGRYSFWRNRSPVKVVSVNRKEQLLDVAGQDVLTSDRVTVRLTIAVTYRIVDPVRYVTAADDARQSLYRDVQLAVRGAVALRTLDAFLADKSALSTELTETVKALAASLGLAVIAGCERYRAAGRDEGVAEQGDRSANGGRSVADQAP